MLSSEDVSLSCSVKLNFLDGNGMVKKCVTDSKTSLHLMRNEFRDILMKIESPKMSYQYLLKDISLHTRFVKDGKATIKFTNPNLQVLVSNCPPNKLSLFLKTVMAKVERSKVEGVVGPKQRLLSQRPRSFEEISPLTAIDINILQNKLGSNKQSSSCPGTPKTSKRKREETEKGIAIQNTIIHRPISSVLLTVEQRKVMSSVMSGKNVFFTGSAGTGKSFLLKRIIGALAPDSTFATASTGAAACHIGGITLHSFAGIGSGNAPLKQCIEQALRKGKAQQWKRCQHLVVDEISMVDGELFQKLEQIARAVRNNDKPFGGIQLILSGDFFQLPPVCKPGEKRQFCFQTSAWQQCIDVNIELTEVKRQKDSEFINILQAVRKGRCTDEIITRLRKTSDHKIDRDGILATRLSTHKDDVNFINKTRLEKLSGDSHIFHASDSESGLSNFMNNHCSVEEKIELKVGAQVMLAKNIDIQKGLVNGSRGVVIGFESKGKGLPIVKFLCGVQRTIDYEKWSVRALSGVQVVRRMLPLKLAWAISVHKSQGMTLDCVEVSLLRVFECGQAYVALSRATSLEGLRVLDIDPKNIRADPEVLKFYSKLQETTVYYQSEIDSYL